MKNIKKLGLVVLLVLSGCSRLIGGMVTSDERRIWVLVTEGQSMKLFRCADANSVEQPPRAVCVQAPLTTSSD